MLMVVIPPAIKLKTAKGDNNGPGGKKIDDYVLREALGRQKRLCVGFNKETGEKLYRPAVKLSK
jgi:hypothetical protein